MNYGLLLAFAVATVSGFGCTTAVSFRAANELNTNGPVQLKPHDGPVAVYMPGDDVPVGLYVAMGVLQIRDTGFTTIGGSLEAVVDEAIREAQRRGASAVRVLQVYPPDWRSTIYRIDAQLLALNGEWESRPLDELGVRESLSKAANLDPIEGIWAAADQSFKIAIVAEDSGGSQAGKAGGFVGVVIDVASGHSAWKPNLVRLKARPSAAPGLYLVKFFDEQFRAHGATTSISNGMLLELEGDSGRSGLTLVKEYPPIADRPQDAEPSAEQRFGSGFAISRTGLVVTNWHVVSDGIQLQVVNPALGAPHSARVVARDVQNDLAILQVQWDDASRPFPVVPFAIASARTAKPGDAVFTIGYPLPGILGGNAVLSSGEVSATTGPQDDARLLQISAPIQPGNSGGPLVDASGCVIGVVTSTLNPIFVFGATGSLPQNVNFAVKSEYLISLLHLGGIEVDAQEPTVPATKATGSAGVVQILVD